jgi:hypothetical protein
MAGSLTSLGAGSRRFKSYRPDQYIIYQYPRTCKTVEILTSVQA